MDDEGASARRYRERAAEVQAAAKKVTNPDVREKLLDVAASYERLAKHARWE